MTIIPAARMGRVLQNTARAVQRVDFRHSTQQASASLMPRVSGHGAAAGASIRTLSTGRDEGKAVWGVSDAELSQASAWRRVDSRYAAIVAERDHKRSDVLFRFHSLEEPHVHPSQTKAFDAAMDIVEKIKLPDDDSLDGFVEALESHIDNLPPVSAQRYLIGLQKALLEPFSEISRYEWSFIASFPRLVTSVLYDAASRLDSAGLDFKRLKILAMKIDDVRSQLADRMPKGGRIADAHYNSGAAKSIKEAYSLSWSDVKFEKGMSLSQFERAFIDSQALEPNYYQLHDESENGERTFIAPKQDNLSTLRYVLIIKGYGQSEGS